MDKRTRHRLEYFGYRTLSALLGVLSFKAASSFGATTLELVGPLFGRRHSRLLSNLEAAYPDASPREVVRTARKVWRNLGRTMGEFFRLDGFDLDQVEVLNGELLEKIATSGKGAVICGAHQTNWEAAGVVVSRYGLNLMGVYRHISNPLVDADIKSHRVTVYKGGLSSKLDFETPMRLMRHLRLGGSIAVMVDQRMSDGQTVPFFGRDTTVTTFPALAARQCGVPLVLLTAERLPGLRFRVRCDEIPVPVTGDRNADAQAATAVLHQALEASIARAPEQWMWTHRRWN